MKLVYSIWYIVSSILYEDSRFETAILVYYIGPITKKPPVKEAIVDIDEISWKRIEDYVFRWYPILQGMNLASL